MSFSEAFWIVFGMFCVTFAIRFCLFAQANKLLLPKWMDQALSFVPISVLSSIIAPMILFSSDSGELNFVSPWFIGAAVAFIVGIWKQNQLLTIGVAVVAFYLAKLAL